MLKASKLLPDLLVDESQKDYEVFRNTLCVPDAVNVSEGIAQMTDQSQEWFQVRDDHTCLEAKMIQAIPDNATFMSKVLETGRKTWTELMQRHLLTLSSSDLWEWFLSVFAEHFEGELCWKRGWRNP